MGVSKLGPTFWEDTIPVAASTIAAVRLNLTLISGIAKENQEARITPTAST